MQEQKRESVSLLGPVLLICLGLVLLMNTLGILDWSIWWTILRLWPVLLIAAGLDLLIGRRSIWGSLLASVLLVGVFVGALWLSRSDLTRGGEGAEQIRQPLGGAAQAQVVIEPGVGVLRLDALAERANLVEGVVYLGKNEEIAQSFSLDGDTAIYDLRSEGAVWVPFTGGWDEQRVWELGLSPGVALQLQSSLGAGGLVLDLSDLNLENLDTNLAVGRTEVTLPAKAGFQAQVSTAVGETVVYIPKGLAMRIHTATALGSRQLPEDFRDQGDGVYTSPGYAGAANPAQLDVVQAMGFVRIRYAD